ncbi:hypothetical protein [Streptomyces sp. NPDC058953]|uniref:hypothetical protein n=1 Tax=unclassified Streptomyces TaxID=2593676 RepID=UPI00367AA75B
MIDLIVHALEGVMRFLAPPRPRRGRHAAPEPPTGTDPWRRPWTSPTQDQAQAVLRAREEEARRRRKLYVLPPGSYIPLPPGLLRR